MKVLRSHPYARAGETDLIQECRLKVWRHPYARAGETPARRDASRKRHPYARAGLKRPNGDQPKPYEGYVIPVTTPWSASPAPGPVAQH